MNELEHWATERRYVASKLEDLLSIGHTIHSNPEIDLQEQRASEFLVATLRASDLEVEPPVAGLDTTFVASYQSDKPGPRIGFVAERSGPAN